LKTILIISYSPLHRDPRILRQIQALKQNYKIATIGYTQVMDDTIIYYPVKMPEKKSLSKKMKLLFLLLTSYKKFIIKLLEVIFEFENIFSLDIDRPDVIIANDWDGLFLASSLKSKHNWTANIYFDAHEYSPKEFDNSIKWRLVIQPIIINALKKCKADIYAMSTVCDGIAREYERFFDFPAGFVKIVTNAAEYNDTLKPNLIGGGIIRLIHHGGAMKIRRLELMIEMMKYLDPNKYELTFMLVKSEPEYYDYILQISKQYKNIKFIEPVCFSEIVNTLNNYDIGVFLLLPEVFNYKYALPNKLFEFIQARLAIAIGPSVEMVKIVEQYNLGIHSQDFTPKSLAKAIAQLTPEKIMEYKRNSDKYAKELSAEENIIKIQNIVTDLAGE
jgi:glycosyltransferase involved in cell wall biosynthesis